MPSRHLLLSDLFATFSFATLLRWRTMAAALFVSWLISSGPFTGQAVRAQSVAPGDVGVLLLEGNRTISGRIREETETYAVEQGAGTVIVSKEQVLFVGIDLKSIYVHLRDQLPQKATSDDHIDLARWCVGYKLMSEARFELQTALELSPGREDIRRNLHKLDSILRRPPPVAEKPKAETPAERLARGLAGNYAEMESLGGLTREAGQEFTRRIQPILMHNCMASACHGPQVDNAFKLQLVRFGTSGSRQLTEKNLLTVLDFVDQQAPRNSPLWELLQTNHGARGRSIFLGTKGREQQALVEKWILSLGPAESKAVVQSGTARSPFSRIPAIQPVGHIADAQPQWKKGNPAPGTASRSTRSDESTVTSKRGDTTEHDAQFPAHNTRRTSQRSPGGSPREVTTRHHSVTQPRATQLGATQPKATEPGWDEDFESMDESTEDARFSSDGRSPQLSKTESRRGKRGPLRTAAHELAEGEFESDVPFRDEEFSEESFSGEPEVEPIVSQDRPEDVPEPPRADPFNPSEFNSQQRLKRSTQY